MIHVKTKPGLTAAVSHKLLKEAAHQTLQHQSVQKPYELTILLSDNAQLRELNRSYLGIDSPTDVLSFASDETDPESRTRYLGDVIISIPRAEQQALSAGHPLEAETQLLVVHGILHLLGHDHAGPKEKSRMWQAQAEILESLGLKHIRVHEE